MSYEIIILLCGQDKLSRHINQQYQAVQVDTSLQSNTQDKITYIYVKLIAHCG